MKSRKSLTCAAALVVAGFMCGLWGCGKGSAPAAAPLKSAAGLKLERQLTQGEARKVADAIGKQKGGGAGAFRHEDIPGANSATLGFLMGANLAEGMLALAMDNDDMWQSAMKGYNALSARGDTIAGVKWVDEMNAIIREKNSGAIDGAAAANRVRLVVLKIAQAASSVGAGDYAQHMMMGFSSMYSAFALMAGNEQLARDFAPILEEYIAANGTRLDSTGKAALETTVAVLKGMPQEGQLRKAGLALYIAVRTLRIT